MVLLWAIYCIYKILHHIISFKIRYGGKCMNKFFPVFGKNFGSINIAQSNIS